MLQAAPVRAAIRETYECLRPALDRLSHTTPATVRDALDNNAFIFSGFKTYHSLREVGLSLTKDDGHIKPLEEFKEDVRTIHERYNERYLEAEYEHAVGSALMADRWHASAPRSILEYRTAGDSKVRPSHEALDRTRLPKGDPFWQDFFPPNGWGCRCDAVEVLDDQPLSNAQDALERGNHALKTNKQELFRGNPGRDLRLFPDKHPYFGERGIAHCSIARHASGEGGSECEVLREVERVKIGEDEFSRIATDKGSLYAHVRIQSHELGKNIEVAKYLANTYDYDIRLWPDKGEEHGVTSADSFNDTLGRMEEYKVLTKVKAETIKSEVRKGYKQARDLVLMLPSPIDEEMICDGLAYKFEDSKGRLHSVRFIYPVEEGKQERTDIIIREEDYIRIEEKIGDDRESRGLKRNGKPKDK